MGANRRYFALGSNNQEFIFRIDTTKIVTGATNGSENPLKFKIPLSNTGNNFILRINDGRPDVVVNNTNYATETSLTFATSGVYEITFIGSFYWSGASGFYDRLKMFEILSWSLSAQWNSSSFEGCTNLTVKATNTLVLPSNSSSFFRNIKGFEPANLSNILFNNVSSAGAILTGVTTLFTSLFNSFMTSITSLNSLYAGLNLGNCPRIEIIAPNATTAVALFGNTGNNNFNGELILNFPNVTSIDRLCNYMPTMPSLAKVTVQSVTVTNNFLRIAMATVRVDETLIAWANLPSMVSGVTWDWKGSKYSNNPAVIAAYNKITTQWGVIFNNLTMA